MPIGLYGFQHYLSILGSLILIPLVIVPAMGGTRVRISFLKLRFCNMFFYFYFQNCRSLTELIRGQEDTAMVVSTVLFVSGITTLLHTSFGTRLPLIQGPSFVYLAPALAIINSTEFQGLSGNVCSFANQLLMFS